MRVEEGWLVASVIRTYATRTATGDVQRCTTSGKVCYSTVADADACAVELRVVHSEQVPYPCRGHFHLTTQRRRPHEDEQEVVAVFAQALLDSDSRGLTREELRQATGWEPDRSKKFRQMLARFERSRLVDCEGQLVMVADQRRATLVEVALTGELPQPLDVA